jgi:signal transduction histidine kinase
MMRLDPGRAALGALVAEVLAVYEDIAEDKNLRLTSDIEPGLSVVADARRLRQVLANLVDNAIKYTPSGGQVTVRARQVGSDVRIDVIDTGIGIPPHDLPRIWERLYRGDQSRAERGLGLGLSLVRAIVAAHGGTVEVASEPGSGSTFTLRLPADRQTPTITHM